MVLVEFYRTLRNPSISETYSFHSGLCSLEDEVSPSRVAAPGLAPLPFPCRWLSREQSRRTPEKPPHGGALWKKGHGGEKGHICKRMNSTYNWVTGGKLLDADHDFLGEGARPKHLRDQAFAARLLCCQLPSTEQHFIRLKGRRVDTGLRCEAEAGSKDPT